MRGLYFYREGPTSIGGGSSAIERALLLLRGLYCYRGGPTIIERALLLYRGTYYYKALYYRGPYCFRAIGFYISSAR